MESKHRLALDARLLAVDFERRRPAFADFAARGNDEAVAAVRALAGGGGAAAGAHLWGGGGCGKTHLLYAAAAAAARARGGFVAVFDSQTTKPPPAPRPGFVAVDNLESLAADGEAQTALFAWLNRARQAGDAFVLTASRRAPSEIGLRADLTTRVLAGLVFRLRAGDDETKRMALRARAKRLGYDLPGEVADLFLARLPRDMASLARAMDALDARLLQTRAPLSKKNRDRFSRRLRARAFAIDGGGGARLDLKAIAKWRLDSKTKSASRTARAKTSAFCFRISARRICRRRARCAVICGNF